MSTLPIVRTQDLRETFASSASELATGAVIFVADVFSLFAAFSIAVFVWGHFAATNLWGGHARLLPLLAVFPVLFGVMNLYPGVLQNPVEELRRATTGITVGMLLLVAATFLVKESNAYSRAALLIAWPTCIMTVVGTRTAVRSCCGRLPWWGIPSTLVGAYDDVEAFAEKSARSRPSAFESQTPSTLTCLCGD